MQRTLPIVGIIMNERIVTDTPTYTLATKYVIPVVDFVKATPVLLPPVAHHESLHEWLGFLDGIILTGSTSDIHPERYGESIKNPSSVFTLHRGKLETFQVHFFQKELGQLLMTTVQEKPLRACLKT